MVGGVSFTIGLDDNGSMVFVFTPEAGGGSPGPGGFVRAVGGSGTVDDLLGGGISVSGGAYGLSASATVTLNQNPCTGEINKGNGVYEVGYGTPGVSVTAGRGYLLGHTEVLGNFGRWLGGALYDLTH